ncbi:RimK family alpha-L-glutamate ligase [Allonocardiopsis opalescens]|uniref:[lysine-biosynthesis-protein LysW]--L-2-aminoadipate ligase n=1 Tax=Allonocardiopsis opalescens TaxID=1144618 RepID=A0A2T0PY90_9ACTN|nr:RimK family alpha-L-glutamate ligase [Allonocardiopsis opalescens]PRX96506.1 [lysine-biosynthesis-protein LysW]--L-2-aminoadipate ligase [Allonocardiopsis opalescens]
MSRDRIGVIASRVRTEEKSIMAALDARGAGYDCVDARTLWRGDQGAPRWSAVLNREIAASRALYTARSLEAHGETVVNSAAATEVCTDKWRTSLALRAAGVPSPPAVIAMTPQAALAALDEQLGYPAVLKPLVGSWGRMVSLLPDRRTAQTVLEYVGERPAPQARLVYLQRFVPKPDRDIRVLVAGGAAVAASFRTGEWRTNAALGGRSSHCPLGPDLAELALAAARAVGAELAGVDVIEDEAGGLHVLEVNDRVEFAGLQSAVQGRADVAGAVADHIIAAGRR